MQNFFMKSKKGDGHPLKETPDMVAWRQEFSKLTLDDHIEKLKGLGLDKEDIEEFKEDLNEEKEDVQEEALTQKKKK